MKEKRQKRFKELLKNNLVSVILLFIVLSIITVFAGNVIVKEGSMNIDQNLEIGEATLNVSSAEKRYLSLDGDGDYVDLPTLEGSIEGNDAGTISAWIKRNTVPEAAWNQIFMHTDMADNDRYFLFGTNATGHLGFQWRFDTGAWGDNFVSVIGSTALSQDTWYHVAGTSNGSTYKLYVNAQEETLDTQGNNLGKWFSDLEPDDYSDFIGKWDRSSGPGQYFNGTIDDVMIFNRSLNLTEILDIYNLGRNAGSYSDADLVSHWRFDDGTANDDKGINNGTLQGNANVENDTTVFRISMDLDVDGDITADSYSDHTPAWSKTEDDALQAILGVKSKDGNIDHSSLPNIAKTKTGRSLGGMITVLVEAVKGVFNRIEDLEQENQILKDELCKKDSSYSWC